MVIRLEATNFAKKSGWDLGSGRFRQLFDPDEDLGSSPIIGGPGEQRRLSPQANERAQPEQSSSRARVHRQI